MPTDQTTWPGIRPETLATGREGRVAVAHAEGGHGRDDHLREHRP